MKESTTLPPPPLLSQYSIAKDRPRSMIRPLQKYGKANLVACTLNVAENIDSSKEPASYTEAMSCNDYGI